MTFTRGLSRFVGALGQRVQAGPVIIGYHRVADLEFDPWSLAVSPQNFAEQLSIIRKWLRPISLCELARELRKGRSPSDAVVVTLDDGYADNLYQAKPLLEKHDVPATVFVTSGNLGGSFWWDELAALMLQGRPPASILRINVDGACRTWEISNLSDGDLHRARCWKAKESSPTVLNHAFLELWTLMRDMPPPGRCEILKQLSAWRGGRPMQMGPIMSAEEVVELNRGCLIEIGAHTVTHPRLSKLSSADQLKEIQDAKVELEALTAGPVQSFAYPHGGHADFSDETVRLVQDSGFAAACVSFSGRITPITNPFRLPRIWSVNVDGSSFKERLSRWTVLKIPKS